MKLLNFLIPTLVLSVASCDRLKLPAAAKELPGPGTHDLSASEFDAFIATPGKLVIVDFHAEWCGPCKQLGPVLEKVSAEFENEVVLGKVDVDQAGDLPGRLGVSSIPDVRLYRDGVMVERFVGAIPEAQVRERVNRHTFGLGAPPVPVKEGQEGQPEPTIRPMEKDWLPPGIERE